MKTLKECYDEDGQIRRFFWNEDGDFSPAGNEIIKKLGTNHPEVKQTDKGVVFSGESEGIAQSIVIPHKMIADAAKSFHVAETLNPESNIKGMFPVGTDVTTTLGDGWVHRSDKVGLGITLRKGGTTAFARAEVLEGCVTKV